MSGDQAIELVNKKAKTPQKEYKLIFMDVNMPRKSGYETTEIIRKNYKNVYVVGVTGDSSSEVQERSIASGMNQTRILSNKMI